MVAANGHNFEPQAEENIPTENKITQNEKDNNKNMNKSNECNVSKGDSISCWKYLHVVYNQNYGELGDSQVLRMSYERRWVLGRPPGAQKVEKNIVCLFC